MKGSNSMKAIILTSAILCCPFSYADTPTPAPIDAVMDAAIVSDVSAKIAADKAISDLKVEVSSQNGVVALTGKISTDAEAEKLIQIAESVADVKDVDTAHLIIKESNHHMADTAITAKVKGMYTRENLFGKKDIAVTSVNVETTKGIVYLTGTVDTQEEADNAVKYAKSVAGVKKVVSKFIVKSAS